MRFFLLLYLLCSCCSLPAQNVEEPELLQRLMSQRPEFQSILKRSAELEIQIIYTQINRDAKNRPSFTSYYYNVDSARYFYPASTVKLPLILLALEKINELKLSGLNRKTPMYLDSVYGGQRSVWQDSTAENKLPSVEHYAKKILVVSDNDAYNALYEFIGQAETNRRLVEKGYNVRILHRLERPLTPDQNRHTEAVRFIANGKTLFAQAGLVNKDSLRPPQLVKKGTGFMRGGELINEPFDFTYKNFYSLMDQQRLLKAVLFPGHVPVRQRFNLTPDDRRFVMKHMSQLPRETAFPPYHRDSTLYDAYCKFLMFGEDREPIPSHLRIFNKVGDAYGYLIDNAYIVDFKNNIEFMLSAVIHTNANGIYNDGQYEYSTVGYPFMKSLGRMIYEYELKRPRKHQPDLSDFRFVYR